MILFIHNTGLYFHYFLTKLFAKIYALYVPKAAFHSNQHSIALVWSHSTTSALLLFLFCFTQFKVFLSSSISTHTSSCLGMTHDCSLLQCVSFARISLSLSISCVLPRPQQSSGFPLSDITLVTT